MTAETPDQNDDSSPLELDQEGVASEMWDADSLEAFQAQQGLAKQRRRRAMLVALLAVSFVGTVVYAWKNNGEPAPVTIDLAPEIKFERLLFRLKMEHNKKLHIEDFIVTDDMLKQLEAYPEFETVILDQGQVSDASMKVLCSLPNLQHLRLRLSPISDEGLKTLGGCQSLWFLNLPHSLCTSAGVAELKAIPQLRQLRLGSRNLSNEVTRDIATLKTLRGIHLIDVPVTDEGLKTLTTLPYLESLYLDNSAVTEIGWQWLYANHPQLHVHVNQRHNDYDPKAHNHH
ncbi:leucine-rich repeat domain-containing protein [Novipirellula artificiosorum]|uniref:Leucine Rich repeats (2 copies) n=1 Tax=Novipirellula artificiosorum TaxID=2528016 RepID=A0A5C6DXB0_9BACT|nr:hypothetical protein [Novipirellula artificiosorum]TWU39656.1 hypothetical protein Poly41_25120 [Novipirellula artificiosorum]